MVKIAHTNKRIGCQYLNDNKKMKTKYKMTCTIHGNKNYNHLLTIGATPTHKKEADQLITDGWSVCEPERTAEDR